MVSGEHEATKDKKLRTTSICRDEKKHHSIPAAFSSFLILRSFLLPSPPPTPFLLLPFALFSMMFSWSRHPTRHRLPYRRPRAQINKGNCFSSRIPLLRNFRNSSTMPGNRAGADERSGVRRLWASGVVRRSFL